MTTLNNSFCRPTNEEVCQIMTPLPISADENHVLIAFTVDGKNYKFYRRWEDVKDDNRKEIPVTHFLDLYHDNITPWRLEEIGFIRKTDPWNIPYHIHEDHNITWHHRNKTIEMQGIEMNGIKTFSQLQKLIDLKVGK